MSGVVHLSTRFFGSLSPRPLAPDDHVWVRAHLLPGEIALWDRMPLADRKHAAGVAREVDRVIVDPPREVIAAALLHDVGKIDSGLGTFGRVLATLVAAILGRSRVAGWASVGGLRGRLGRYLRHDVIGAEMLASAGSDPLTSTWARQHHLPADQQTVAPEIAAVLTAADDD